VKFRAQST